MTSLYLKVAYERIKSSLLTLSKGSDSRGHCNIAERVSIILLRVKLLTLFPHDPVVRFLCSLGDTDFLKVFILAWHYDTAYVISCDVPDSYLEQLRVESRNLQTRLVVKRTRRLLMRDRDDCVTFAEMFLEVVLHEAETGRRTKKGVQQLREA